VDLLVQPYCDGKDDVAHQIFALTSIYQKLEWVSLPMNLADRADQLRARYYLSTPGAIQLGASISLKAVRFYGNDQGFRRGKNPALPGLAFVN
jgi:hypothetical protein